MKISKNIIFIIVCGIFIYLSPALHAQTLEAAYTTVTNLIVNTASGFRTFLRSVGHEPDNGVNLNNKTKSLQVIQMGFKSTVQNSSVLNNYYEIPTQENPLDDLEPAVEGPVLVHPNPYSQSMHGDALLAYILNKNMAIEVQIYDMSANCIFKQNFLKGTRGGQNGYNRLIINKETFDGYGLSGGVYFYLIIHEGTVLAKGKMAVVP
ncbi:hypothetical protein ACFL96_00590 [Thermoproteota archaeon]